MNLLVRINVPGHSSLFGFSHGVMSPDKTAFSVFVSLANHVPWQNSLVRSWKCPLDINRFSILSPWKMSPDIFFNCAILTASDLFLKHDIIRVTNRIKSYWKGGIIGERIASSEEESVWKKSCKILRYGYDRYPQSKVLSYLVRKQVKHPSWEDLSWFIASVSKHESSNCLQQYQGFTDEWRFWRSRFAMIPRPILVSWGMTIECGVKMAVSQMDIEVPDLREEAASQWATRHKTQRPSMAFALTVRKINVREIRAVRLLVRNCTFSMVCH